MLYVVTNLSAIIMTLSVDTLSSLGDIHVQGMKAPNDIVVCRHDRQLYVAADYNCIWRVSADDHSDQEKWLSTESTDTFRVSKLSVTSRGLLVTSWHPPGLLEYSMTDRQLLRVFQPSWDMMFLYHGVETTRGTFVIGHCGTSQNKWQSAVSFHDTNSLVLLHLTTLITLYTDHFCTHNASCVNYYLVIIIIIYLPTALWPLRSYFCY